MRIIVLLLSVCFGRSCCLRVRNTALPVVVKAGSETEVWCLGDSEFDSCTWTLPNQSKCGPLSAAGQKQCRTMDNIDFIGDSSNCKIRIRNANEDENGLWTCSLAGPGGETATASVSLAVAVKATVEMRNVVGTMTALVDEPPVLLTCDAKHTRPVGKFIWHFGEDPSDESNQITNPLPVEQDAMREDGIRNVWQDLRYEPAPEHNDQRLYCTYIQEDSHGEQIYTENAQIGLRVFYLQDSKSNLLLPTVIQGKTLNVSIKFEAVPRPQDQDIVWEVKSGEDILQISINEDKVMKENYIAAPLEQISQHEFMANLKIVNITFEEASKTHSLRIINRINDEKFKEVVHPFNVNVDRPWIDDEDLDGAVPPTQTANIVVSVIVIIIVVAIAMLGVLYMKREQKLCFQNNAPYIPTEVQDQKESLKEKGTTVQHHPYGRPT